MALKNFDTRQSEHRSLLDQLALVANKSLKDLLPSINSEAIMPLRLLPNNAGADRQVNVGAGVLTNPETGRKKAFAPIQQLFPDFTSGSVTFPSTSGGTISVSPGNNDTLTVPSNEYIKVLIQLFADGNLGVAIGTPNSVEADATVPPHASNALPIGFITLFNNAGTIDNVDNGDITQFVGGGGSGGSGSGGGLDVFFTEDFNVTGPGDFSTGNNATVLGGGSIAGSLAIENVDNISGDNSMSYTQAAGSLNDYFASDIIELDEKQINSTVGFSFYARYSGNDDDIRFGIYDVTNGQEISLDGSELFIKSGSNSQRYTGSFFIPDGVTQIRYFFQTEVANASEELIWDDLQLSTNPFVYKNISNIEDFGKVNLTINGFGTLASQDIWVSRVGSYLQMGGRFDPGSPTATQAQIELPFGLQVDTNRIGIEQTVGTYFRHVATTANGGSLTVDSSAPGIILFGSPNTFSNVNLNATTSVTGSAVAGGGNPVSFQTSLIPIEGWEDESEHVITPASTSETTTNLLGSSAASVGDIAGLTFSNLRVGDTYLLSGQLFFDISSNGALEIDYFSESGGSGTQYGANRIAPGSATGQAGGKIDVCKVFTADSEELYARITSISGSTSLTADGTRDRSFLQVTNITRQFLAALPQPPSMLYTSNSGQSATINQTVVYEDKVFDTHNSYNASTGLFTAPESGRYLISFSAATQNAGTSSATNFFAARVQKTGSTAETYIGSFDYSASTTTRNYSSNGSITVDLVEGDQVEIDLFMNINNTNLVTSGERNFLSIHKIGL